MCNRGQEGIAAAMYGFLRQFGMAIGVGVGGSAFQNIMALKLTRDGLPTGIAAQSESFITELLKLPDSAFKSRILEAYVFGFRGVFAVYVAISGVKPKIRLYGLRLPVVDSVWKAIELHDIKVRTFERSSWTEPIADLVDEACETYYNTIPAVFIIVPGDRDLRAAVVKIAKKGFPVHVWSWKNGIANSFTEEDKDIDPSLFRVHYLDPYLETVGLSQTTFRVDRGVINPQSIVVLDPMSRVKEVEVFLNRLRTPVWRYEIPGQREDESKDLAIIPSLAYSMKPDELRSLFMESQTKLEWKGQPLAAFSESASQWRY